MKPLRGFSIAALNLHLQCVEMIALGVNSWLACYRNNKLNDYPVVI